MVTLHELKLLARKELLRCLDALPGSKTVIWDPSLTAPFTLFSDLAILQSHGVEKMVMLPEKGRLAPLPTQLVVFLCADSPATMESVCSVIPAQSTTDYHLIVTPKVSTLSMKMLKEKKGIKENGKPGKLQSVVSCLIDIYVLDPLLFSINIDNSFSKSLQKDQVLLSSTARALSTLQVAYGVIPNVLALGHESTAAVDLLIEKRREFDAVERKRTGPNEVSTLIVLDRSIDLVSPLLRPTSYYALLAEEYQTKWNSVTLEANGGDGGAKPKKVNLSHDEPINEQLADVHVKAAGKLISEKLRTLKAAFDERHDKRTVAEYKAFVQMMPQLNKERDILTAHSEMCSKVIKSNDELQYAALSNGESMLERIWTGEEELEWENALKILCLANWRTGGLSSKLYESHKMDFLNLYGFDKLPFLLQLEENKLLGVQGADRAKFKDHLTKTLKLGEKNRDIFNPSNPSFVFDSQWNPITTRLVHEAVSGSWRRISELLNHFNVPYAEKTQNIENKSVEKNIIVFVIGGITYAEVSSLRNLAQRLGVEIIVGSTEMINTSSFLKQISKPCL